MNKYYLLDLINKIKDIDGNTYFSSSYVKSIVVSCG